MNPQMHNFLNGLKPTLAAMMHSPARNYVIPGLTSWLIGPEAPCKDGRVRVFTCEREHEENILPHSHRFDFTCLVLEGSVRQVLWREVDVTMGIGVEVRRIADLYEVSRVTYEGILGVHQKKFDRRAFFQRKEQQYTAGETYVMKAEEIHSIFFSRGATVLFFEGHNYKDDSVVLEPVVDGETIPLFFTESWMFKKD